MLTGRQIRQARILLQWGRLKLCRHASITENLVMAIESSDGPAWLTDEQESGIRSAFEAAGVIFIQTNGEKPSVRLREGEG